MMRLVGEQLEVVRWRRYGKDRLYVNDAEGRRLGWHDVQSGLLTVDAPERRSAIEAAVAGFDGAELCRDTEADPEPVTAHPTSQAVDRATAQAAETANEPVWQDLALHRPGRLA